MRHYSEFKIINYRKTMDAYRVWLDTQPYYKELENLEDYLIPEPIINEQEYAELEKRFFKKKQNSFILN